MNTPTRTAANVYLTVDEVAELLRCSKRSIHEQTRTGSIPHRRLGRRCLFLPSEIDAWLGGAELERRDLVGGGRVVKPKVAGRV